ncbi:MAG: 50S ribosomal protein L7/L12 [Spirochaetia bacterium]|nr:50S ribosomal protein L7/L12 [Spirochaetota bacterium]MCX8096364.1 50S ribosomal protein L7/L12 [Spirochaetota bacterium]MDW8113052.1 50S ribosomal protein L7/L12 [Spirochaetia bacterium]
MATKLSVQDLVDVISNMTVMELVELRKALEEKFGVSAAMPVVSAVGVAPAGQAAAAAEPEEKTNFDIYIKEVGDAKLQVIKVVKDITGLSLKDAKDIVESGGQKPVKQGVPKDEAEKIKKSIEEAGAVVELK